MRGWTKKLPKGRSYPLKPSVLEAALVEASISLPVELARIDGTGPLFQASYNPAGSFPKGEHFSVSCKAVPSGQALEVRTTIETEVIPQFVEWAKHIERLDAHSPIRREHQVFTVPLPTRA